MRTYRGGEQGRQAGPPLPGSGLRGARVKGQHCLQCLGEAASKCVPLRCERYAGGGVGGGGVGGQVWRRRGGLFRRNRQGRRSVGKGVRGRGDANRHATASTAVGRRLQAGERGWKKVRLTWKNQTKLQKNTRVTG